MEVVCVLYPTATAWFALQAWFISGNAWERRPGLHHSSDELWVVGELDLVLSYLSALRMVKLLGCNWFNVSSETQLLPSRKRKLVSCRDRMCHLNEESFLSINVLFAWYSREQCFKSCEAVFPFLMLASLRSGFSWGCPGALLLTCPSCRWLPSNPSAMTAGPASAPGTCTRACDGSLGWQRWPQMLATSFWLTFVWTICLAVRMK